MMMMMMMTIYFFIYIYIYIYFSLGSSSQFRSLEEGYIIARPVNVA